MTEPREFPDAPPPSYGSVIQSGPAPPTAPGEAPKAYDGSTANPPVGGPMHTGYYPPPPNSSQPYPTQVPPPGQTVPGGYPQQPGYGYPTGPYVQGGYPQGQQQPYNPAYGQQPTYTAQPVVATTMFPNQTMALNNQRRKKILMFIITAVFVVIIIFIIATQIL